MSYSAALAGKSGKPLGTTNEVIEELIRVFPKASFGVIERPPSELSPQDRARAVGSIGLSGFGPLALLMRAVMFFNRPRYPYCEGSVTGDGYSISFFLGSDPVVRKVRLTFYGLGSEAAFPHLDRLLANTGWMLKPR